MGPNAIVLSPEQFAALKSGIIAEVRREMKSNISNGGGIKFPLTTEIKKLIVPIFGNDYQLQMNFSAIARKTFDVRHQTFFTGEVLEKAIRMTGELVTIVKKYKEGNTL